MSIDVASAVLSTNWAELSVVSLPQGTLSNEASLVVEVAVKLKRDGTLSATTTPTDTQVKNWLRRARLEIAEVKNFDWKRRYVTTTLTAGTWRYALPFDFAGGYVKLRDLTDDKIVPIISKHQFDTLYPDPASENQGTIMCACVRNKELWLGPPPAANIIELEYDRSAEDATDDYSYLPEVDKWRCIDFAVAEGFSSLHELDKATFYYQKWSQGIGKAITADGKRKWATMGFRCRSVFQA
jgi:hypothetical protein